jgi:PAS domain S-box-containing protein
MTDQTPHCATHSTDSAASRAVRESEERYRAFISNSSEGIWRLEFDPAIDTALPAERQLALIYANGTLAECNGALARMHGAQSAAALLGKSIDILFPSSDVPARTCLASFIEAGYYVADCEFTQRDAAGKDVHFVASMNGTVEGGSLVRMWGTRRNLRDGKRAEAIREAEDNARAAIEAQAYLAAIVGCSDDAIMSKNLDGVIQSANGAAERLFGYTAAELIGRNIRILIPEERQVEEDVILARIRRGERIEHFETVRVAKDGRRLDISLTVSPVLDSQGRIIGVSKIARDITEKKRAAAERERLLEAERVARGEAERASRVKDEFVAMVSHELRTPLNAILSWTELMMRGRDDPKVMERGLEVVARNTRVQAQLISDLLDVSRIVAGKLRLDIQNLDLPSIVSDAVDTVRQDAAAKNIEIRTDLAVSGPLAGDPARIQQVVWNLLSNAVKFTPPGGSISVAVREVGTQAEIVVSDDGAGISAEFLPHVFDRFLQADRSTTKRYGGLGLGLAIVKHLVELHGGRVSAESGGPGKGSSFTIRLPTSYAIADSEPQQFPSAGKDAWDDVVLDSIRVLVVEDEPDTREFLSRLLQGRGAQVLVAATAPEALALFRIEHPDLLISDIGLPDMDGYDLIRQIRSEGAGHHASIPAIALTAYARSEDRTKALRAGYQTHIAKPVEPNELIAAIASFAGLVEARRR